MTDLPQQYRSTVIYNCPDSPHHEKKVVTALVDLRTGRYDLRLEDDTWLEDQPASRTVGRMCPWNASLPEEPE